MRPARTRNPTSRLAFSELALSMVVFACMAVLLLPTTSWALGFRSDAIESVPSARAGTITPTTSYVHDSRLGMNWGREVASRAIGDAIATVLDDTPRRDSKLIDNPEPNAGVLLGLGLLGLTARRYRGDEGEPSA